jgi:hypothetical protein
MVQFGNHLEVKMDQELRGILEDLCNYAENSTLEGDPIPQCADDEGRHYVAA